VGLDTLSATLSEERDTLEDVTEPYLIFRGFIKKTPRGRIATKLAYEHLKVPYYLKAIEITELLQDDDGKD